MEFDKSRVYTAVNADELKIGSRCVFADTVKGLKKQMQSEDFTETVLTFVRLHNVGYDDLFVASDGYAYGYAYLVEPPAEPKYRPFESVEEAMKMIKAHGGWVRDATSNRCYAVVAYDEDTVETEQDAFGVDALFDGFVFVDDGSPCGVLVEE